MTRYLDVEDRLAEQKRQTHGRQMREWLADIEAYPEPGFCYFIGDDEGRIKIGSSRQPSRRLRELRRDTPRNLRLLAKIGGGAERESYYHHLFAAHHRGGEWFDRHPDIIAEIERLS
jgi:hypothetical protein